ncbi:hypothetical protein PQQ52_02050 [Paraburkholderia sediminicola]|uniref:hypothetical protein n=1 Tax=Paraburkholderia sediminicola TaxID=458836 RepID=UPI0038BAB9BF
MHVIAREEWQQETGGAVEAVRAQAATVARHMQDVQTRATIANFLFDASLYAGSVGELRAAAALA